MPCFIVLLLFLVVVPRAAAQNFVVSGVAEPFATQVRETAEACRVRHAQEWFAKKLPNWSQPCPIQVTIGSGGGSGATSFEFASGEAVGFTMEVQGSPRAIIADVIPHEVLHAVFASEFRQPLPRWFDEGSCVTTESISSRARHRQSLVAFLRTSRGIPFSEMVVSTEYPGDILPLYAQGNATVEFLLHHGGRSQAVACMRAAIASHDMKTALCQTYEYASLTELQNDWLEWVKAGSPAPAEHIAGYADMHSAARPNCRWDGKLRKWICKPVTKLTGGGGGGAGAGAGAGAGGQPAIGPTDLVPVQPRPDSPPPPAPPTPAPIDTSAFVTKDDLRTHAKEILVKVGEDKDLLKRMRDDMHAALEKFQQSLAAGKQTKDAAVTAVKEVAAERVAEAGGAIPYAHIVAEWAAKGLGFGTPAGLALFLALRFGRRATQVFHNHNAPQAGPGGAGPQDPFRRQ